MLTSMEERSAECLYISEPESSLSPEGLEKVSESE